MKNYARIKKALAAVVFVIGLCACDNGNEELTALTEEEKMLYKPTSLTVSFYDAQNSVYGFTFNTIRVPLEPVIQIRKVDADTWEEYGLSSEEYFSYTAGDEVFNFYVSKTEIPLESNCTYVYRAYDKKADIATAEATLKTKDPKSESFTFVHVGDTQDGPSEFERVLSVVVGKADFLLHTGDVVENSKYEYEWTTMLDGNFEYLSSIPVMAISGNHETTYKCGTEELYKHFHYKIPPQKNTSEGYFYSFIYGNVKFIMLNTNDLTGDQLKAEQYDWLLNELELNTCQWTVVALHNPLYSVGKYGANNERNQIALTLQRQLGGLFAQYGVDVVLQGHDHCVSRTYPIDETGAPQEETIDNWNFVDYSINPNGVIYVMNGTSGSQTRDPYFVDETLYSHATSSPMSTWAEFEFNDDTLTVTVKYYAGGQENTYYSWGIKKPG